MKLASELADIAEDNVVSSEAIDELAQESGVPREQYYAALPLADLQLAPVPNADTLMLACVGGCQGWGAIDVLGALLDERDRVCSEGKRLFVGVRPCLDRCLGAAVVEVRTADGVGIIANANPEIVREVVAELHS